MRDFPTIEHIDDILDEFERKSEFAILHRDDYIVIDYNYVDTDTFSTPVLLEGRGLKFNSQGILIGRPFQKFFNLGEKPETMIDVLDWNGPVHIEVKHDGSMIHPVYLGGQIVLMTRKGWTDTAKQCERECDVPYDEMDHWLSQGFTPIYEYVSPNNQIVIPYEKPELRLLAIRHIYTGKYVPFLDHTKFISAEDDISEFVGTVRSLKGSEGVVLVWPDGHRVKLKADEYVSLHRTIDVSSSEARLLEVILNNNLDDLLPLLPEERAKRVRAFTKTVCATLVNHAAEMRVYVDRARRTPGGCIQKEFALGVLNNIPKPLQAAYFKYMQACKDGSCTGNTHYDIMSDRYKAVLRKQKDVDEHRDLMLKTSL